MTDRARPDRLAAAVRALVARNGPSTPAQHNDDASRLDALERDLQEVRTRVNGLFFAVITASVMELVTRTVLR